MTTLSNYLENEILDHILGTGAFTMPASVWVALFTTNPTDADTGTELSGAGYARQPITFEAAVAGAAGNDALVEFGPATASWGTITHIGIYDAVTGGNLLLHGTLAVPRVVGDTDKAIFVAGTLTISID